LQQNGAGRRNSQAELCGPKIHVPAAVIRNEASCSSMAPAGIANPTCIKLSSVSAENPLASNAALGTPRSPASANISNARRHCGLSGGLTITIAATT